MTIARTRARDSLAPARWTQPTIKKARAPWAQSNGDKIQQIAAITEGQWVERHRAEWREARDEVTRIIATCVGADQAERFRQLATDVVRALRDGEH